jgi:hypothetical protein
MKESPSAASDAGGVYTLLNTAADSRIALTAVKVAIVVGTILNVINQSAHVIDGDGVNWIQFVLNYIVTYCVSSYSGARNELRKRR